MVSLLRLDWNEFTGKAERTYPDHPQDFMGGAKNLCDKCLLRDKPRATHVKDIRVQR